MPNSKNSYIFTRLMVLLCMDTKISARSS